MNVRSAIIILLIGPLNLTCKHRSEIILEDVSDLPEYFSANYHFGKDIKSIRELKEFILVTGKIDTTVATPPRRLAVFTVNHEKIFLTLNRAKTDNGEISEEYSGNGYNLDLTYKEKKIQNHSPIYEGYFTIRHDNLRSGYDVVGTSEYY